MSKILILLDTISYTTHGGNPHFRNINLHGHYESAVAFQKELKLKEPLNKVLIVRRNHLENLKQFVKTSSPNEKLIIIYCGHGNPGMWCVGISRNTLLNSLQSITNRVTIVSDSCFSDTMNIANSRLNTVFLSGARASGENCYAFFTCDGGYLTCAFYKYYSGEISINVLWGKLLTEYYDDGGHNMHQPKLLSSS